MRSFVLAYWYASDGGAIIQVLGMQSIVQRKLFASSGVKFATCAVKLGRMVKILGIEVADKRTEGIFYVAVLQAVLLFRLEM